MVPKGLAIGRYERDEMKPFIEVATKMADILEVSKFNEEGRNHIFSVIDTFIVKRKILSIL